MVHYQPLCGDSNSVFEQERTHNTRAHLPHTHFFSPNTERGRLWFGLFHPAVSWREATPTDWLLCASWFIQTSRVGDTIHI